MTIRRCSVCGEEVTTDSPEFRLLTFCSPKSNPEFAGQLGCKDMYFHARCMPELDDVSENDKNK